MQQADRDKKVWKLPSLALLPQDYVSDDCRTEDQYKNPEEFSYSWAALGNKSYSKFYRPVLTIKEVGEKEIPISSYNVSEDSMLRELVENVGKGISDLSYVKAKVPVTQTQNKTITNKERDDK